MTNLQGDIIAILDNSGDCVAEYSYDAWGNCTIVSDTDGIGEINPLRYKGYYFDSDTGLYCIGARYYDSNTGRYIDANSADSVLQGELNLFEYDTNPMKYVCQATTDLSSMGSGGKISSFGYYDLKPSRTNNIKKVFETYIFTMREFHEESNIMMMNLEKYFKCVLGCVYKVDCANYFHDYWNGIGYADVIVLNTHSGPDGMFNNLYMQDVRKLKKINCKALIILGCNAGHYTYLWNNIAYEFSKKVSGTVVASDGTVGSAWEGLDEPILNSYDDVDGDGYFRYYLSDKDKNRKNLGWVLYKTNNVNITWYPTDIKSITLPSILDYLQNTGFVKF